MTEKRILFKNRNGLHARPAARVVEIASRWPFCEVFLVLEKGKAGHEIIINAKSIMNLIINAIPANTYMKIRVICSPEQSLENQSAEESQIIEELVDYLSQEKLVTED